MATSTSESAEWRKFLAPVVSGLAILITAATAWFNTNTTDTAAQKLEEHEKRITKLETQQTYTQKQHESLRDEMRIMREDLREIKVSIEQLTKVVYTITGKLGVTLPADNK